MALYTAFGLQATAIIFYKRLFFNLLSHSCSLPSCRRSKAISFYQPIFDDTISEIFIVVLMKIELCQRLRHER